MSHKNATFFHQEIFFFARWWHYPKMSWSVKTHLKSWRDTRTCKSKKPALLQVHSFWNCFVKNFCSSKCKQKRCLSCIYLLPSSLSHFLPPLRAIFKFSNRKSSLFNDSTSTKGNHNLSIDNHFFIRQRLGEKNFFSPPKFLFFSIIGISFLFFSVSDKFFANICCYFFVFYLCFLTEALKHTQQTYSLLFPLHFSTHLSPPYCNLS